MIIGYRSRSAKTGVIFNFSKPIRDLARRFSFAVLILLSIILILAGKSDNNIFMHTRSKLIDILSPFMKTISMPINSVKAAKEEFKTYFYIHDKNKTLDLENTKLRLQVARLYQVQKENEKLRELLHYVKDINYEYTTAKIVGNVSELFTKSSIIDIGSDSAIMKGQAVIMDGGLVGRVIETGKYSSRILLLTDINSKIPVISLESRERSILSGNNTDFPNLLYMPKESKVTDGEIIITSGDGDMLPPGLMVGKAIKNSDGSYKVSPFVNWRNIEYVSVLGVKEEKNNPINSIPVN